MSILVEGLNELDVSLTPEVEVQLGVGIRLVNPPIEGTTWRYSLWDEVTNTSVGVRPHVSVSEDAYIRTTPTINRPRFLTDFAIYHLDSRGNLVYDFLFQSNNPAGTYGKPRIYLTEQGLYEYDVNTHTLIRIA